jgi:hypothetical protein
MRHGLIAGIAAVAIALAIGALLATWESGNMTASLSGKSMEEGRAATSTDPANPAPSMVNP